MARFIREHYVGDAAPLPELPECGRSDQHVARPGLAAHEHANAFEICLLCRGEVDWWVEDRIFTVRAGEVFLTRPGERHGAIGSMIHPCELFWFQYTAPPCGESRGVSIEDVASLQHDLMTLPVRHFAASKQLQRSIRAVIAEHRRTDRHSPLAIRAALYAALVGVIREANTVQRPPKLSRPVQQALTWMAAHMHEQFTTADVADAVGLSMVRLQVRFRRELQCSIGEHRTRLRIHAAKLLLHDTDQPITLIATKLGFTSSQYFATVFRQHAGTTPTQYRDRLGRRSDKLLESEDDGGSGEFDGAVGGAFGVAGWVGRGRV